MDSFPPIQIQQAQMAAILGADDAPFEALISRLMSSSNDQRSQAEILFNLCRKNDPDTLSVNLSHLLQHSPHYQVRGMSAVLLRKLLNCDDSYIWPRLSLASQFTLKSALLMSVQREEVKSVTKKLCDTISELASGILAENCWPELLPFMFQCVSSDSPKLQESAFLVFSRLSQYIGEILVPFINDLHAVFLNCLTNSMIPDVCVSALSAAINFIQFLPNSDDMDDLLPAMMRTLNQALKSSQEATAQEALELLIELAEAEPRFLRRQIVEVVESMLQIAEAEALEEGTRHLAVEFVITLAEARERAPGMMRKLPQFMSRLFGVLMKMLLDIEDDPLWYRADAEHEDAGETSGYSGGQECLDRISIALGGNTIAPVASELLHAYLAAPEWQKHHAALIALAQIANGCSKVMINDLEPVVNMALTSFQDPHPRVRWAAINAIGQLSIDLGPDLQVQYHHRILPALAGAMADFQNPRVQAHAASAVLNFSENCTPEILTSYMDEIVSKLLIILQNSKQMVQERALTAVATAAYSKPPNVYAQQLYDRYKKAIVEYIVSTVLPSLREKHGEFMLRELVQRWKNHKVMVWWLSRLFPISEHLSLQDVGISCFRELVFEEVRGKANETILALMKKERMGGQIYRALLKNVLKIYVDIGMGDMDYYEDFETAMLDHTTDYYYRMSSLWVVQCSCPAYMLQFEMCLKKEKERAFSYLHSSSEQKLVEEVVIQLSSTYEIVLLSKNSGCHALLRDGKVEDLSRMYRLYQKDHLEPIGTIFRQYIIAEGTALVQQAEDAARSKADNVGDSHEKVNLQLFFREVIRLHDKFTAYVNDCFAKDIIFNEALKEAFESILNKGVAGISSAELLATFCDNFLEKDGDNTIEESLELMVKLLTYISEKDIFAEFYRENLSRRLLTLSINDDLERRLLRMLKQHCGEQCTFEMERMVTDLALARENQGQFEKYLAQNSNASAGVDLTVTVLDAGLWPMYKSADINLPEELVRGIKLFEQFYQKKSGKRKLTWIYSLGSCHINGKFGSRTIELIVGTYQAAVLMCFNTSDSLSYSEIMTESNLADEDLIKVLQSFSCAKYAMLLKEPNTKNVSSTDVFTLNSNFNGGMKSIRIPLPSLTERKKVVDNVDQDRRYAIDAAIVHVMKSRKVLGYQQLVKQCTEQLTKTFKPEPQAIKKRIEDLIGRGYIERDKENSYLFRYLA